MSAKDEVMALLFDNPERETVNFKVTLGPNPGSEERIWENILSALRQVEDVRDNPPVTGRSKVRLTHFPE